MPQMAPLSWLFLFILFIFTFFMFNVMNYYVYSPMTPSNKNKHYQTFPMIWKW